MSECTVPKWMKPWFDRHFAPECDIHDARYVERSLPKFLADWEVAYLIGKKYWWSLPVGVGAAIVLAIHPEAYALWYRDENNDWRW